MLFVRRWISSDHTVRRQACGGGATLEPHSSEKTHMRSAPSLGSFSSVAFETLTHTVDDSAPSPFPIVTIPQAFDLTAMLCNIICFCWQATECTMLIWVRLRRSDECSSPQLIVADISLHQWACVIGYFEHFVRNSLSFAVLLCQIWPPLFRLFAWNSPDLWRSDWLKPLGWYAWNALFIPTKIAGESWVSLYRLHDLLQKGATNSRWGRFMLLLKSLKQVIVCFGLETWAGSIQELKVKVQPINTRKISFWVKNKQTKTNIRKRKEKKKKKKKEEKEDIF